MRDFCEAVNIGVWYDANTKNIYIERNREYDPGYTGTVAITPEPKKDSITIRKTEVSKPNSVGGVDVTVYWRNTSGKDIKYVTFTVEPYNAVNDIVLCSIKNTSTRYLKCTGPYLAKPDPLFPNAANESYFGVLWYNHSIRTVKITEIAIEYMDGEKEIITSKNVVYEH